MLRTTDIPHRKQLGSKVSTKWKESEQTHRIFLVLAQLLQKKDQKQNSKKALLTTELEFQQLKSPVLV